MLLKMAPREIAARMRQAYPGASGLSLEAADAIDKLLDALSSTLWMAGEWYEHNGSGQINGDDHLAAIRKARALLPEVTP